MVVRIPPRRSDISDEELGKRHYEFWNRFRQELTTKIELLDEEKRKAWVKFRDYVVID